MQKAVLVETWTTHSQTRTCVVHTNVKLDFPSSGSSDFVVGAKFPNVSSVSETFFDFSLLNWFYVCFSPLFSGVFLNVIHYGKRMEILLYSVSFCPLK